MGEAGISKELRDRLQGHAMSDVSSKHYDRYDYLAEKTTAADQWGSALLKILRRHPVCRTNVSPCFDDTYRRLPSISNEPGCESHQRRSVRPGGYIVNLSAYDEPQPLRRLIKDILSPKELDRFRQLDEAYRAARRGTSLSKT